MNLFTDMGLLNRRKKLQSNADAANERSTNTTPQSHFITIQLGTGNGIAPLYVRTDDGIFNNEAVASCLYTNAAYCGKIDLSAVAVKEDGTRRHDWKRMDYLLKIAPNPTMTPIVFWERVAYYYFAYNNSFIYLERDMFGEIIALWSIDPNVMKFNKISTGETVFTFDVNGTTVHAIERDIVIIARRVFKKALFGDYETAPAIQKIVDLINLNYKGIENTVLTSATIRFIAKYGTRVNEAERKKELEELQNTYLSYADKNTPLVILPSDSVRELVPVSGGQQKTANYLEVNQWNAAVYKFYGCPEKVISGQANEEEMLAYYERTPEPFFIAVAEELTRKLYTKSEIERNNRIEYSDKKLMYYSMATRLSIYDKVRELGMVTLGTLGDLLGVPVAEGKRNVVVTSQNYIESVKTSAAQGNDGDDGKNNKEEGEANNG